MLHRYNPYVSSIKSAMENMTSDHYKTIIHADKTPAREHRRRNNALPPDEVAILFVGQKRSTRDIVIEQRDSLLEIINETHGAYDSIQYPLLFWNGEDGYPLSVFHNKYTNWNFTGGFSY